MMVMAVMVMADQVGAVGPHRFRSAIGAAPLSVSDILPHPASIFKTFSARFAAARSADAGRPRLPGEGLRTPTRAAEPGQPGCLGANAAIAWPPRSRARQGQ